MSWRTILQEIGLELSKENETAQVIKTLEDNWYDSDESLLQMTISQWNAMRLPIRLHTLLSSKLKDKSPAEAIVDPINNDHSSQPQIGKQGSESVSRMMEHLTISTQNEKVLSKDFEEKEMPKEEDVLENKEKQIKLLEYIQDLEDIEEILHFLNIKGEKEGVAFKKGNIQYWDDHSIKYKSLICSCKSRHSKAINKTTSVIVIKEFIEQKFKVELSYKTVYSAFRKTFPLLGPKDAMNFIDWCEDHGFLVEPDIDNVNKHYTKLFICSDLMKLHYECYGDIVLLDSTYRVNKYKLPIVVFSGFTHTGRNCLFGVGIVNNEVEDTYYWLISQFFKTHGAFCKTLVTDHDLAIEAVLDKHFKDITHLLCKWHILQSFRKNFSYLASMNCGNLRDKILTLPYIEFEKEFEARFEEVKSALGAKNFSKSATYLQKMYDIKNKWAEAFLPKRFTGGVHTTSRAESVNALIKKYVGSKSEVSDFVRFLQSFEKKSIFDDERNFKDLNEENSKEDEENKINREKNVKDNKTLKSEPNQYESHPLILDLKKKVFGLVLNKHLEQFTLSHNYVCKYCRTTDSNAIFYEVKSAQSKMQDSFREVVYSSGKYSCVCPTYYRHGLVCRHIFALAMMFQDKTCEKLTIHNRWKSPSGFGPTIKLDRDNYDFNTEPISKYLKQAEPQETKEEKKDIEERKEDITFKASKVSKGAPKKEKRMKSATERSAQKTKTTKPSKKRKFQEEANNENLKKVKKNSAQIEKIEKEYIKVLLDANKYENTGISSRTRSHK